VGDEAAAWTLLNEGRQHAATCETGKALECVDRALAALGDDPAPAARAVAAFVRALAPSDRNPDPEALRQVTGPLMAHGQWEAASIAQSQLGADAVRRGDLAEARIRYVSAIGCCEAAGARWTASAYLRKLALAELALGEKARAVDHLAHALQKLQGVALLNARRVEAECEDSLGDAFAALGDRAEAEIHWKSAMEREERLERVSVAAKIRTKLEGPAR
jgi:tetratricopeptide (TPR) repeat protein